MSYSRNVSFSIILALVCIGQIVAQKFSFAVGRNLSEYHLVNTGGQLVDYLKPSSGMFMQGGIQKSFLDTLSLQVANPERAVKFTRKPVLSKLLSMLTYSAAIQWQQLNAIGDVQQIPLKYETDYAGLEIGLGARFHLFKLFDLGIKGALSANKLVYGSQLTGNTYYLLKDNPQFDDLKLMKGFQIDVQTKINSSTDFLMAYRMQSTISPSESNTGKLDFSTQSFSIGLTLHFKK